MDAAELKLVEEIWRNSTLTWRQAEEIIQQAVNIGKGLGS